MRAPRLRIGAMPRVLAGGARSLRTGICGHQRLPRSLQAAADHAAAHPQGSLGDTVTAWPGRTGPLVSDSRRAHLPDHDERRDQVDRPRIRAHISPTCAPSIRATSATKRWSDKAQRVVARACALESAIMWSKLAYLCGRQRRKSMFTGCHMPGRFVSVASS